MRRACILRQLGRCADYTRVLSPSRCGLEAAPWLRPLRRGLSDPLHLQRRSFSQSSAWKEAWNITPPKSPSVHPHPHHDAAFDALPLPEQLRSVMRLLAHSVVVCTSAAPAPAAPDSPSAPVPRGMTMSSFTSLSLRPTPLVTFNIATPSRTLDAVSRSRRFNIHVLSGDVAGARVAEWFRKGNADDLGVFEAERLRDECGCEVVVAAAETPGETVPPLLKGPGVLFALRCSLLGDEPARGLVRVRDHVIVLAEIVDIVEGQGGKSESAAFGLAYADRLYRQLGSTMALAED